MKTGVLIQARMGSSRRPGKVLAKLGDQIILKILLERMATLKEVDQVIVATSEEPQDDPLANALQKWNIDYFRGSQNDVLSRFLNAAIEFQIDRIIRVCGDAPFTDPEGIRQAIAIHNQEPDFDMVSNRHEKGWAPGSAADLLTTSSLKKADKCNLNAEEREHILPALINRPDQFKIRYLNAPVDMQRPDYFFGIDYPDQLTAMNQLCSGIKEKKLSQLKLEDMIRYADNHPELQSQLKYRK